MDKDRSHTAFADDCLRLPEEIGNLPYDISYDMDYDKLNMETQPLLHDDISRSDSVMRRKSDFESTQNDSGVLEDCSPSVKAVDQSENSTSDLDLTDVVPDRCLFDVAAEGQGHGSEATCRSVAETVQVKKVAGEEEETYMLSDAVEIPAETPARTSETDGHENESVKSEEKSPIMKYEDADDNQVDDGDTARQSDVVSPPDVQSDRPLHEMVNVDLFVQTHSDLMVLLLMEDGVATHEEKVTDLFCDTAILLHEEFHTSETLKEVTLRNHDTSVYGCSVLGQETFFQLKKTRSGSQAPSEKELSMCIDKDASETLWKCHHIQTT
ncbi:hypothetical protein NP493_765g01074 [Ridgeia piscesae]|uniref:Uncharacterized protein n=1 Tax=Ridgeia piscesae TaxID=27915 RepID=A0AAD9NM10_RIDPI|nr:hypothetical protein NP493_765g01074 [Ridgeia piscesae]